ncbi:Fatty acid hydroxylase [Methylocella tundrae]|uniref:Fatty acid hydroxylase n=1 Tax=Methylocella tundrae TaxID=227605 RepID=A0A8B6M471_METTU|nr:sterol desaturase family protein [Methylocella tundrae]VTZ27195.1 Fatty acid hydroxylase [Methylocella tundrae]VTZ49817.1 Fatty acid hydroxylase [Methylocella tundrae]
MTELNGSLPSWLPLSVLTFAVQMVVYHGVGLWFEWCDRTGRMRAFKMRAVERQSYFELLPRVLINQFFILLPSMMLVQFAGLAFVGAPHLGVLHFLAAMILMGVGHDIVQYAAHRFLLHRPGMIRKLGHSVHHSTGASRAISACYMGYADFFLEIVLPYLLPLIVVAAGADVSFHLLVASLGAIGGLYEHSGYDFSARLPRGVSGLKGRLIDALAAAITSKAHAEHHRRSNVSFSDGFGSPGICDTFFATRWDLVGDRGQPKQNSGQAQNEAAH